MGREKKIFASDIQQMLGKEIRETFYLSSIKTTQAEAASWMELTLKDKSGFFTGRIWAEYVQPSYVDCEHQIVEVIGRVEIYRDRYELRVVRMSPVEQGQYIRADYVDELPRDKAQTYSQMILSEIESMMDERLKALCFRVITSQMINKMSQLPADKSYAYAYGGGLLAHIADMLKMVNQAAAVNQISYHKDYDINLDLIKAGVILYRVGIVKQFKFDSISYWMCNRGSLVGVAADSVAQVVLLNQELPHDRRLMDTTALTHVIMALNRGVEPQTKEAVVACSVRELVYSMSAWDECFYFNQKKANYIKIK